MTVMSTSTAVVTVGVGPLAPESVVAVARDGAAVSLSSEALTAIDRAREAVEAYRAATADKPLRSKLFEDA